MFIRIDPFMPIDETQKKNNIIVELNEFERGFYDP